MERPKGPDQRLAKAHPKADGGSQQGPAQEALVHVEPTYSCHWRVVIEQKLPTRANKLAKCTDRLFWVRRVLNHSGTHHDVKALEGEWQVEEIGLAYDILPRRDGLAIIPIRFNCGGGVHRANRRTGLKQNLSEPPRSAPGFQDGLAPNNVE